MNKTEQFSIFENENKFRNKRRDSWLECLLEYLPENSICVEIGVSAGVNSKRIVDILKPEKLYLIDPWYFTREQLKERNNPDAPRHKYMKDFVYHKLSGEPCVEIIEDYSYNVFGDFTDEMFDFAYIDGDHSYKSVYEDLTSVFPKVKSGGIIAGHDYFGTHEVILAVNDFIKTKNIKQWFPPVGPEMGCDGNSDFFFIKP